MERKKFLDIPKYYNPTIINTPSGNDGKEIQIKNDVIRSYQKIEKSDLKLHRQDQLFRVLLTLFERNPELSYTQGFHDIAAVILTFAKESLTVLILEKLAKGHLRPYLCRELTGLISVLNFLFPLMNFVDSELLTFLDQNDIDSSFAASYVLTFFAHNALTLSDSLRYLDFFISSHPLMTVYSVVTLVCLKKDILMVPEADTGTLMQQFNDLLNDTDVNVVIRNSIDLFQRFPPTFLLQNSKDIKISKDCFFLDPTFVFPYPYPSFPSLDKFPIDLYQHHLDETTSSALIRGILSAIAIAAAIGMRLAFI